VVVTDIPRLDYDSMTDRVSEQQELPSHRSEYPAGSSAHQRRSGSVLTTLLAWPLFGEVPGPLLILFAPRGPQPESAEPFEGIRLMACSARAVMVRLGFTPRLAGIMEPSIT
jgi:hypothetical protein